MVPLCFIQLPNSLVWAPLLPTLVTQDMSWLERSPGLVWTQVEEQRLQEHGVDINQTVSLVEVFHEQSEIK